MVATSGDRLLAADAVEALRKVLIPRALVVTPNLPEAAALTGATAARNEQEMEIQARELLALGARNVLIKGGHGSGDESVDLLVGEGDVLRLSARRVDTKNTHGTGCTLSSAIAAGLAKGLDLKAAAREAKAYVTAAIAAASTLHVGHGHGPLHHFHADMENDMTTRRTFVTAAGATLAGAVAAPSVARAQTLKWRMVTSWPKRLPGPACRPSASPIACARCRAASSIFPCRRLAKLFPLSRCWMPSATASPRSDTPRRSIGRARCRRRPFSPRCRSD